MIRKTYKKVWGIMAGLRSVTVGTQNLSETINLFHNILGLNYEEQSSKNAVRFGDADLSPGTRIHFIEVPNYTAETNQVLSIGLRTPTDSGLVEYQEILESHDIEHGEIIEMNNHKHFEFKDDNGQFIDIYSNEHNSGVPLGMPSENSAVNPLHQVQGLGPVIIQVNELLLTTSILSQVFGLEHFAEYAPTTDVDFKVQVFRLGEGGLGGELHIFEAAENIPLPEYGAVDQIEISIDSKEQYRKALQQLESIGIPYQTLKQNDSESLRITENSGLSFTFTHEKA